MNNKTSITLVFGGRSAEHDVSLQSAAAIYRNLDADRYTVASIYISREGKWKPVSSPLIPRSELEQGPFYSFLSWTQMISNPQEPSDIYFPVLHGPNGEDGTIQGFFEMAGVPYIGASVLGSALAMDKAVAKIIFASFGLPVTDYIVIRKQEASSITAPPFDLPVFVKPANLGSSVGISKVKSRGDFQSALETAFSYDKKILVEKAVTGRELECSVLGNDSPQASLPGEVIPDREFYDYQDKYIEGKTQFGIPADLPASLTEEIQRLSLKAFQVLECRGMARVDFFLENKSNQLILNEINTIPGFTEISMYPKLWEISGLSFPRLLDRLIELGLDLHSEQA